MNTYIAVRRAAAPSKPTEAPVNRAGCSTCGDVVEARYVHDADSCACGGIIVYGGLYYSRRAFIKFPPVELPYSKDLEAWLGGCGSVRIEHVLKGDVGGTVCGRNIPPEREADCVRLCDDCAASPAARGYVAEEYDPESVQADETEEHG